MTSSELDKKLNKYLLEGLPIEFIKECSSKMAALNLPQGKENLARKLMFHLTNVMKILIDNDRQETIRIKSNLQEFSSEFEPESVIKDSKRLLKESGLLHDSENMAFAMGFCCYTATVLNKKSGEDFLTLYADSWFRSI